VGANAVPYDAAPPFAPLTSIVPLIVTLPVARIVTGVLAALRVYFTVTPDEMLTVV
jgi:hypothetical protein